MKGSKGPTMEDLQWLFTPNWQSTPIGSRVSVVVTDIVWHGSTGVGKVTPGEQRTRVVGLVPPEAFGVSTVTLLSATFLDLSPMVELSVDASSSVLCHSLPQMSHVHNYVELCAGGGFSSLGFSHVGFMPKCAVELQPKLAALHKTMHPSVPVLTADITDDSTAAKIHAICPEPATIMAGVACQPYSRAGKQEGGQDTRAATLPATLKMAHYLQAPALIIECVVPARDNQYVTAHIQALEHQLKYHVVNCTMKLEEVWSGQRYRWWLVATHSRLGRVIIPAFPKGSTLVVRDLMPYTRRWSDEEESQLTLTAQELDRFQLGGEPLRKYLVQADQKLPTALHSWGGQTQSCACECRPQGFADYTLQSRGLFAQLLQIPGLGNQIKYRHLHAIEVAIHNGVPPMQTWSSDARLNLCAVGQLASPFHATWIASALKAHVQKLFTHEEPVDPLQSLGSLKQLVMQQSREFFPTIPRILGQPSTHEDPVEEASHQLQVSDHAGVTWTLEHHRSCTVRQLIEAECDLLRVPLFDVQVCNMDGQVLPDTAKLSDQHGVLLVKSWINEPAAITKPPEVPFTLEDLQPCPEQDDPISPVDRIGPVATQVDSDADIAAQVDPPVSTETHVLAPQSSYQASDASVLPLMQLTPASLLEMLPPRTDDVEVCNGLRFLSISWTCRSDLLDRQEHAWADDEMLWHMQATVMHARKSAVVLDPLLATTWMTSGTETAVTTWLESIQQPSDRIITAVLSHGHWTPVIWLVKADRLEVHTNDHADVDLNGLNPLHGLLCHVLALPSYNVSCHRRSFGANLCGAAAIAFLIAKLNDGYMPATESALQAFSTRLRDQFRVSHAEAPSVVRPWCWGTGADELPTLLATMLQFHGVPQSAAKQRAKLVLQSLGKESVQKALEGVHRGRV